MRYGDGLNINSSLLNSFVIYGGENIARRARRDIVSQFSHIVTLGFERGYIFKSDIYKEKYLNLIHENAKKFDIKIIAYCIMDNHTHLCLYHNNIDNLAKYMHYINSEFARYYNLKEDRDGYVYRGRYYLQEILSRKQLYNTIAYIHNNPVKAMIVDNPNKWKYSTYNDYMENKIDEEIIKLVFETNNYINIFNYIHKNYNELQIMEPEEEIKVKDPNLVIKEFLNRYHISQNLVVKENVLLLELINELKIDSRLSNKEITELLKIDKNRTTRLVRKLMK